MTKRTVLSVLQGTYDKERFIATLKEKGIDTVLRYTEEGRIYGATFIDHRTGCVLNGSRMGRELSANALQEHFTLPYAGQPPVPLSVTGGGSGGNRQGSVRTREYGEGLPVGMGLFCPRRPGSGRRGGSLHPGDAAQEEKEEAQGLGNVISRQSINNQNNFKVCHNKKTI